MRYDDDDGKSLPAEIPMDDGVSDAAGDAEARIFSGRPIIKYSDRQYMIGADRDEVPLGTRKIFLSTVHYWQPWIWDEEAGQAKPGKPVIRKPGERLPERDELEPAYDDQSQWRTFNGQPQDPWQETRAVLLEDPDTGEQCVFVTNSGGGRSAVMDLCSEIQRMRQASPSARPIIELRWANMDTKYGMKTKPQLRIAGWKTLDNVSVAERSVSAREAKKIVDQRERGDEIPSEGDESSTGRVRGSLVPDFNNL
jgi:hypothetical protein